MRSIREVSIKRKLTSIIMLTSTVTLVVACGAFFAYELTTFPDTMKSDISNLGEILGRNATSALLYDNPETAKQILASLASEEHVISACIYNAEGEVFAKYFRGNPELEFVAPEPQPWSCAFENDFLVLFQPIVYADEQIGTIHMKADLKAFDARLSEYSAIVAVVLLTSILLAFVVSSNLQRVISAPILELARTARTVSSEKNYTVRAVRAAKERRNKHPDALDTLFDGFNDMLEQIQTRDGDLLRAQDDLEERVRERTHELQQEIQVRTETEKELKKTRDEAIEASRIKSEFLANMSHEIRTPMNGIIGMTELTLDTPLNKEQREYLAMVKASADSLLQVINDILDFSKIEAGKFELDDFEFKLRDSIGDIVGPLGFRAHEKGLELAYHILPDVPDYLVGDAGRLRQVVINLVGNAIKFTQKGEVVVRVELESLDDGEVTLHFSVTDTGIGIPEEKKGLIFEAFTQADGSSTRQYGGTGLGLAISSQLVEMMNGKIWVESEVGKGSCFHFTARFEIPRGSSVKMIPAEPKELHDLPVLIVDDNATNRRILEDMVRNWNMRPVSVAGGEEAIYLLQQCDEWKERPGLVLLDANMPHMDGFGLVDEIKKIEALEQIKIIILTSAGRRGDAARCRRLGINAYLTKPIKQSELLDAMMTVLGTTGSEDERPQLITRHSMREEKRRLHILLAEDNPVNQKLAVRILEKVDHKVTVANNGREAVDAHERQEFDIVLMDVQMSEMGGFEATGLIREREKDTGRHIPIVAMTAHAMKGDRETCLAAGMDEYVPKPIKPDELLKVIDYLVPPPTAQVVSRPENRQGADQEAAAQSDSEPGKVIIDWEALLERVEGDTELLKEIAALFRDSCPQMMEDIRKAVAGNDAKALESSAHALKGSVSNFYIQSAVDAALRLEKIGSRGNLDPAPKALEALEKEIEALMPALHDLEIDGVTIR